MSSCEAYWYRLELTLYIHHLSTIFSIDSCLQITRSKDSGPRALGPQFRRRLRPGWCHTHCRLHTVLRLNRRLHLATEMLKDEFLGFPKLGAAPNPQFFNIFHRFFHDKPSINSGKTYPGGQGGSDWELWLFRFPLKWAIRSYQEFRNHILQDQYDESCLPISFQTWDQWLWTLDSWWFLMILDDSWISSMKSHIFTWFFSGFQVQPLTMTIMAAAAGDVSRCSFSENLQRHCSENLSEQILSHEASSFNGKP